MGLHTLSEKGILRGAFFHARAQGGGQWPLQLRWCAIEQNQARRVGGMLAPPYMRSTAHIKSHPLHPMLVAFPIGFFIGTLVFDVLGVVTGGRGYFTAAYYMNIAGIVGAVLAAIPGLIDYLFTVPPDSSEKKRAAKHGVLNTAVLLLFAGNLWYRGRFGAAEEVVVAVDVLGVVLVAIAGWMGGTLVFRNQIGVDMHYADAGRWNEERMGSQKGRIRLAKEWELEVNQMKLVHVNGKRIVVARSGQGFAAFDDHCTHTGGSVAGGSMICGTVQCPWHGSQFDVHTGALKAGPAKHAIKVYNVVHEHGKGVFLEL